MDNLNEEQKKAAIAYMNRHQDDGFGQIADVLSRTFGVPLTEKECFSLFLDSQMG